MTAAANTWARVALDGKEDSGVLRHMLNEQPRLLSVVFERTCNLSCRHCVYPDAKSSASLSKQAKLHDTVVNAVRQMPADSSMIHVGRIFRPEHLRTLKAARLARSDMGIGMIDNGSFGKHVPLIRDGAFRFDWLDISVDGNEQAHNVQRQNAKAYAVAREGIRLGREVADKVTSLMTLTSLNYSTVREVGESLLVSGEVDEYHFTPMTPYRPVNMPIEMSPADFRVAFEQIAQLTSLEPGKVFLRLYRIQDIIKLAEAVGHQKVWNAMDQGLVDLGRIIFYIDNVEVTYYPLSIWPQEEVVIDADGVYRFAGSVQYSLEEYRNGENQAGKMIDHYTSNQLDAESNLLREYKAAARKWWLFHGKRYLGEEVSELRRIRSIDDHRPYTNDCGI